MATVKETYTECITEGMKAAKGISDPFHKATAYAELARALAATGLIGNVAKSSIDEPETPAPAAESVKEAITTPAPKGKKATAKAAPVPEPVEEVPAPTEEPELSEEWTEEMVNLKADQIEKMGMFKQEYGEESVVQCVKMFSEGSYDTLEDITPLNIDAFVNYMEGLANEV